MKAKQFLADKTLSAVEVTEDILLNLVVKNVPYGLKVDTSSIVPGTKLELVTDFTYENDILTARGIVLDLSVTDMLMLDPEEVSVEETTTEN
jgi:hypothetical protein